VNTRIPGVSLAALFPVLIFLLTPTTASAADKPLKVFILAGQSNMQGHASVSTFDSLADDPKTAALLKDMRDPGGKPRVCERVWISSVGCLGDAYSDLREKHGKLTAGFGAPNDKIGPEFTFGITMEKRLGEPILIIKTAWGGRSLHTDFRPPSAGPEQINDFIIAQWKKRGLDVEKETEKIHKNGGVFYRHMIEHVQKVLKDIKRVAPDYDTKQGYELAGFVWFQGFNDLVDGWTYPEQNKPGGYDLYADLLAKFIRDVRKDLSAPKMPFVIGVMGIGGEKEGKKASQMHFRQAQRKPTTLEEFQGNVVAVETAQFWDEELDALQQRMERLNDQLEREFKKDPNLKAPAKEEARKKAIAEQFKPDELKRLKAGVSNGGYHYLGAARIMAPIGKAFAEAIPLSETKPAPPATEAGLKPVKVFILAGQSNMEGAGFINAEPQRNGGKGSLEFLVKDAATADKFKHLVDKDGKWIVRNDVWIHYLDRKGKLTVGYGAKDDRIGPELGFGAVIGDAFEGPILLIKLAWGGKSLAKDFRPPSSGGEVGPYYKEIIERAKAVLKALKKEFPEFAGRGYELIGFGWHQGWNDRVNQTFNDEYEKNLANFIRDVRKDLGVKNLPFVIAETGMSGPEEKHPRALSLMKAQAAVAEYPEFKGNVAFVGTKAFWRDKDVSPTGQAYHWNTNAETYYLIGEAMGNAMKKLCATKPPAR
jgi:alpha-galactosidase